MIIFYFVVNVIGRLPKDSRKFGTHYQHEDGHCWNWCIHSNWALSKISQWCHWPRKCLSLIQTKEGYIRHRWWWTTMKIVVIHWVLQDICIIWLSNVYYFYYLINYVYYHCGFHLHLCGILLLWFLRIVNSYETYELSIRKFITNLHKSNFKLQTKKNLPPSLLHHNTYHDDNHELQMNHHDNVPQPN